MLSSIVWKVQYIANGSTSVFAFPYRFLLNSDLKVYVNTTLKALTTDYTLTGAGGDSGGNVTFLSNPANGSVVTIVRVPPKTQIVDYTDDGDNPAASTENNFDKLFMSIQELDGRVLKLGLTDTVSDIGLIPDKDSRANGFLSFDSDGKIAIADIGIVGDVSSVASISADVTSVAAIDSAIPIVAAIDSEIIAVASIDTEVANVSSISADVVSVSANSADVSTVADNIADVNTCADNIDDIIAASAIATSIPLSKYDATSAPTANDDSGDGYKVGSRWIDVNTNNAYVCVDASLGAAIWVRDDYVTPSAQPAFSAHRNGTEQNYAAPTAYTKLQLTTEDFDTNSNFDNATNYRFTPTVAGYYQLNLTVGLYSITDGKNALAAIFKNGAVISQSGDRSGATANVNLHTAILAHANGSTDYFEAYIYNGGSNYQTISGEAENTRFSGARIA